jgi:hypothetical protein
MPIADPEAYIDDIVTQLTRAGLTIDTHYVDQDAEGDDGQPMWQAFIGFKDETDDPDERPDEEGFIWSEEEGWRHLTGPRTDFGPFNTVDSMDLSVDAPADRVVAAILAARGES